MNKKKITAIALVLILAVSLVACVKDKPSDTKATPTPSPTVSSTPSASTEASPSAAPNVDLALGTKTDTTCTNEALGISVTLPDGWRFATDEEIALALQIGADILADSEAYKEALLEQPYFFDAMAVDATGTNNFNINYNDLTKTGVGAQISEATYATISETQLKQMSEVYKDAVYTQETLTLGDEAFTSLSVDATATALKLYQRQYYKKVNSNYLVVITITGESKAKVDEIASMF